jgi:hypothetical protein
MRYDSAMTASRVVLVSALLVTHTPAVRADEPASLAEARALYNAGDYDGAIAAATLARRDSWVDAASLVIARAHVERYRQRGEAQDLAEARTALGAIDASRLAPRDEVDLLVGMGQSLYLGETFGASAELFDSALARSGLLSAGDRRLLLDWWATALDREAQNRPFDRRTPIFERITVRMEQELRQDPGSAVANYWLVVAARGRGDLDGAWNSAVAAWVRATLAMDSAPSLRADLDRLVMQALIPERSRTFPTRDPQEMVAVLVAEWQLVKDQWR